MHVVQVESWVFILDSERYIMKHRWLPWFRQVILTEILKRPKIHCHGAPILSQMSTISIEHKRKTP